MSKLKHISRLVLASGIFWAGTANATSICELDLVNFEFTNTGVCGQVITTLDGVQVQDLDEGASVASASTQQGANPPTVGADGASGIGTATYPNPDGTGGSVGAASSVSGGGGLLGEISSFSGAFYIGEFVADDGLLPGSDPFDLTVNLDISGEMFVQNSGLASLAILFAAVDATGATLGEFAGVATLGSFGAFNSLFFTDPLAFTPNDSCTDFTALPQHECMITADTTESFDLAGLVDGDVFGLFLTIGTIAFVDGSAGPSAAHSNFANTIDISFEGGNVTTLPATIGVPEPVPEPASIALVLAGVLIFGFARQRCSRSAGTFLNT